MISQSLKNKIIAAAAGGAIAIAAVMIKPLEGVNTILIVMLLGYGPFATVTPEKTSCLGRLTRNQNAMLC